MPRPTRHLGRPDPLGAGVEEVRRGGAVIVIVAHHVTDPLTGTTQPGLLIVRVVVGFAGNGHEGRTKYRPCQPEKL